MSHQAVTHGAWVWSAADIIPHWTDTFQLAVRGVQASPPPLVFTDFNRWDGVATSRCSTYMTANIMFNLRLLKLLVGEITLLFPWKRNN